MSHGTYIIQHTGMTTAIRGMYMSLRKSLFQLLRSLIEYMDKNQNRQGETHLSNPQVQALIPRSASNGMEMMCHGSN